MRHERGVHRSLRHNDILIANQSKEGGGLHNFPIQCPRVLPPLEGRLWCRTAEARLPVQALESANLQPGARVLVHAGSGGVGHFAVQLAKQHWGAYVVSTSRRADFVKVTLARASTLKAHGRRSSRNGFLSRVSYPHELSGCFFSGSVSSSWHLHKIGYRC